MSDAADEPLGYLLHRAATALRGEVTTVALEPAGVSFPQYVCMRILSKKPGRSNAELARDLLVSPQAMNMVVRELQSRGLVTRPAAVTSGRSLPAELTGEGRQVLDRLVAAVAAAERRALAALSPAQRVEFRELLAALDQPTTRNGHASSGS